MEDTVVLGPAGEPGKKEYVGYIWLGDEPGTRLSVWAESATEAVSLVGDEFGEGHVFSIWNEEDASRPRSAEAPTGEDEHVAEARCCDD